MAPTNSGMPAPERDCLYEDDLARSLGPGCFPIIRHCTAPAPEDGSETVCSVPCTKVTRGIAPKLTTVREAFFRATPDTPC